MIEILIALAAIVVVLLVVVAMQPSDFRITRMATLPAPAPVVFAQVNNFHNWQSWSPWARLDPNAENVFGEITAGIGATFQWKGNAKVGEGKMTLIESRPPELVRIQLEFIKPFQATNLSEFEFMPVGDSTVVTWTMSGTNHFLAKAVGLFINCDQMVGAQFEQGLANLKSVTETITITR